MLRIRLVPSRDDFAADLLRLRKEHGSPSYEVMYRRIKRLGGLPGSKATFHRMLERKTDALLDPGFVNSFLIALGMNEAERADWEERRQAVVDAEQPSVVTPAAAPPAPRAVADVPAPRQRAFVVVLGVAAIAGSLGAGFGIGRATASHAGPQASPAGAPAGMILGPLNYQAACDRQYGPGRIARASDPHSAFTWRCAKPGETAPRPSEGVELSIQCLNQYGPRAVARAFSADDPYSWKCLEGL